MKIWEASFKAGDIVLHKDTAGHLLSCVLHDGTFYGVIDCMQLVQAYTSYAAKWRPSGSIEFVLAAEMTPAIMGEGGRAIGVVVVMGGGLWSDAMRSDAMR